MRKFFLILLCFAVNLTVFGQKERITSFHSDIEVQLDGNTLVTETITVFARGDEIKRGIERSLPTVRVDSIGNRFQQSFSIEGVLKNGRPEKYAIINSGDEKIIRIGKADVFLRRGEYTYTIKYNYHWQLGYYNDVDEIYWNVTGSNWRLPIDKASASITLPEGVEHIKSACYTGKFGSAAKNCSRSLKGNEVYFETKKPLARREGLTVAVGFTPGVVEKPPAAVQKASEPPPMDERKTTPWALPLAISGLLGLLGFFFFTWRQFGVDPPKPTVIPRFNSPENMSPAQLRYIQKRFVDRRAFTSSIVNLAVKGALRIEKSNTSEAGELLEDIIPGKVGSKLKNLVSKEKTFLVKQDLTDKSVLSTEEKTILNRLFSSGSKIELAQKNHSKIRGAYTAYKTSLKNAIGQTRFVKHNIGLFVLGLIISMAVLVFTLILIRFPMTLAESNALRVGLAVLYIGLQVALLFVISLFFPAYRRGKGKISTDGCGAWFGKIFFFIWAGIFFFSFASTIFAAAYSFINNISVAGLGKQFWLISALLLILIAANIVYFYFIKKPSAKALKHWSNIEGFDMYLRTAEEKRLNMLNPPEKTPEHFEKMLPYAIALNAEVQWGDKFSAIIAKAIEEGRYNPAWYQGGHFSTSNLGRDIFSDVSGPVNSGMTSPSSSSSGSWSSGSGGGGFSGGGGGGGGGGGW